jgi:hypothetical protein
VDGARTVSVRFLGWPRERRRGGGVVDIEAAGVAAGDAAEAAASGCLAPALVAGSKA